MLYVRFSFYVHFLLSFIEQMQTDTMRKFFFQLIISFLKGFRVFLTSTIFTDRSKNGLLAKAMQSFFDCCLKWILYVKIRCSLKCRTHLFMLQNTSSLYGHFNDQICCFFLTIHKLFTKHKQKKKPFT